MTTPLVLHDTHAAAGAVFGALGERAIALSYGDAPAEAAAVRESAGVIDWGGGTRLRLTQTGTRTAHDFVEGLVSNAVPPPPTDRGCYATLLTNTGKIIADCRVWARSDGVLVTAESTAGAALRQALEKYAFLDDIAVADVSDTLGVLGLHGPQSAALFETACACSLPGVESGALVEIATTHGPVLVTRTEVTGEVGFDLLCAADALAAVWDALRNAGATPFGLDAFHILRVEAGTPWMGAELDDRVLPNQVNLEHAISFTKGCYVGQEPVAKLHYLGRSNRQLVGLLLGDAAAPPRDTPLVSDGKPVGRITSAVVSPTCGQTIALAMCKTAASEPGAALVVGDGIPATCAALPFYERPDSLALFPEADIRDSARTPE